MCGIIALVPLSGSTIPDNPMIRGQLDAAMERIEHRGPDGRGVWIDPEGGCALAHVRLSINDLSPHGSQPLHSPSAQIHAVVNGEIYFPPSLRSTLEYQWVGTSDSELVIALYLKYGLSFLNHLRGEFALAIWDDRTKTFLAARDRFGIKPLFYRINQRDQRLEVSAEVKGFLGLGWEGEWDVGGIFGGGWGQDERTCFRGVCKIRPGHYLVCRDGGEVETRCYWDATYPDKKTPDPRTPASIISQTRTHLLEAVRIRLKADVPVGIYLSGGIDSSAVAGIAAYLVKEEGISMGSEKGKEICCFSIGFEDGEFDESEIAARTAKHLGVRFLKSQMSEASLAARFEDAVYHIEHHNNDLNFVGKYILSELPRQHGYKVVLTGEGADEHFGGYPLYQPDFLREPDWSYEQDPMTSQERAAAVKERVEVVKKSYDTIGGSSEFFDEQDRPDAPLGGMTTASSMAAFTPHKSIFAPWVQKRYAGTSALTTIVNNIPPNVQKDIETKWHPLNSAMYVWGKGHLSNLFLSCLGDRVEMAHSVEGRTPFLDHHLTEFLNGIPPSLKIHPANPDTPIKANGNPPLHPVLIEKYALREAVKEFVTPEVYARTKHPYSAPTTYPIDGPVHIMFQRLVTKERVEKLGFVSWARVEELFENAFGEGGKDIVLTQRAWRGLLMISCWGVLGERFGIKTAGPL